MNFDEVQYLWYEEVFHLSQSGLVRPRLLSQIQKNVSLFWLDP